MGQKTILGDVEITGTLTNNGESVGGIDLAKTYRTEQPKNLVIDSADLFLENFNILKGTSLNPDDPYIYAKPKNPNCRIELRLNAQDVREIYKKLSGQENENISEIYFVGWFYNPFGHEDYTSILGLQGTGFDTQNLFYGFVFVAVFKESDKSLIIFVCDRITNANEY